MLMISHNLAIRKHHAEFYEQADIIRMNTPWYTLEELEEILKNDTYRKFLDINIQVRMKPKKSNIDYQTLLKLAGKYNVEWVAISNVEDTNTYKYVRELLKNDKVKICAKIESELGCKNYVNIIKTFDGVLVDTEDLAFEIGWNRASVLKEKIYNECEMLDIPHFRLGGTIFEVKCYGND
jgi:hypothetical protein